MKNMIIVICIVIGAYFIFIPSKKPVPDTGEGLKNSIVMYSTPTCRYCKLARQQFLAAKVDFVEYDITRSTFGAKRFQELNGRGVPLIEADGIILRGYNRDEIARIIKRYK